MRAVRLFGPGVTRPMETMPNRVRIDETSTIACPPDQMI